MSAAPTPAPLDERLAADAARLATRHADHVPAETVARRGHRHHDGLRRRLPRRARPPLSGLARSRSRRVPIAVVRRIRDDIDSRITDLPAGLPSI
ncbi:hypothetical protein ACFC09_17685 [Streptomyces sp. NPDC056161]|uniref:hypothetical protein n=1 Tax=Streptomyces sp. NPDC056161 TaxID=3345732 RepID=UPI0035E024FA